jgi:hypothetical protein
MPRPCNARCDGKSTVCHTFAANQPASNTIQMTINPMLLWEKYFAHILLDRCLCIKPGGVEETP